MRKTNLILVSIVLLAAFFCAATGVASAITLNDKYVGNTIVDLEWSKYESKDFSKYELYREGNLIHTETNRSTIFYRDDVPSKGVTYNYEIKVYNSTGGCRGSGYETVTTGKVHGTITGIYTEWSSATSPYTLTDIVYVKENATLYIENGVTVNGNYVVVTHGKLEMKGVTVKGSGFKLENSDHCSIKNCAFNDSYISLSQCSNSVISDTVVENSYYGIEHGIYLKYSNNCTLTGNTASNNIKRGIYLYKSNNCTLTGNTASNNSGDGIYMWGHNNTLSGNTASNNSGDGIFLIGHNNTVSDNTASNNSDYGIFLNYPSNHCTLSGNAAHYNDRTGISLTGHNNTVSYNTASNNSMMGIGACSGSNTIVGNIVSNNRRAGIWLSGANNMVSDNIVSNNIVSNNNGIWLSESSNSMISNNTVCAISYGFNIYLTDYSTNNTLTGNTASNGAVGIKLNYHSNNNNLTGNNVSNTGRGITLDRVSRNVLTGNNVSNTSSYGIEVRDSSNNTLTGNIVSNNSGDGIYLMQSCNNCTLTDNIVRDNKYGIMLYSYSSSNYYNTLTGNIVSNNSEDGIYLRQSCNCTLTDNIASNNSKDGIHLSSSSNYNTLTGNIVSNNSKDGSQLEQSCNCTLTDNIVRDNKYGIRLYSSSNATLTGNIISNNSEVGSHMERSCNCTLTDNIVRDNKYGIYLYRSSNYNTLTGNIVSNNSEDGIYLRQSCNCTLTDNIASNNKYGIKLYSWYSSRNYYNTLTGNIISNNSEDGIYLRQACNCTFTDNLVRDNKYGIELYSSSDNMLTDNNISNNTYGGICMMDNLSMSNTIKHNTIVRNTANNCSWSIYVDESCYNEFKENTVGSKYPTKISICDYSGNFKIRGVEDPPESPKLPEYPVTRQSISNYVEIQNLSKDTELSLDFHYDDKDVKDINEESLKVWKYNGTAWDEGVDWDSWNGTRKLDTENNIVGVEVLKFCIFAPLAGMPVHNINTGKDFNTIQEAINDGETVDGHMITVDRGYTVAETTENVYVDKELTIIATSGDPADTVIEAADEWKNVITVASDEVTIQGFTIKGATHKNGVNVYAQKNVKIEDCVIRDNYFGVLLEYSEFLGDIFTWCTIKDCQFMSNTNGGVYINQSDHNDVLGCTFEDKYGVIIDSGTENSIRDNTFTNNAETAIYDFSGSKNSIMDNQITGAKTAIYDFNGSKNSIMDNLIIGAKIGMLVENTEENEIRGNEIENADECGVKLDNSENNNLVDNDVKKTPTGFFLVHSNDNTVEDCRVSGGVSGAIMGIELQDSKRNTITGCSIHDLSTIGYSATGIRIFSGSTHNKIYHSLIYNIDSSKSEAIDVGSPLNEFYNVTIKSIIGRGNSEGKGIDVWAYANTNLFQKIRIEDVRAKNNSFGFYLYGNNHNKIESCTVTNISADYNNAHGLHLNRSNSTEISNTTLKWINATSNDSAIVIEGTDGTNTFDNVTLGAEYPTSFNLTYNGDIEIDEVETAPEDHVNGKNISKYVAIINRSKAWADIKMFYNDSELGEVDENSLRMWKHDGGWAEVPPPNGVNTVGNYVYANITSFSVFAPLGTSGAAPPNITSFAPSSSVSDTEGATRTFNITIDQTVNVSWQINGTGVQTNMSVIEASYTNVSAKVGIWNVSAIVTNTNGTAIQTWTWTVGTITLLHRNRNLRNASGREYKCAS